MSTAKVLAETALRCVGVLKELPLHEKAAVLGMVGQLLQAEAKSQELAQAPADQHYPQQVMQAHGTA